MTIGVFNSDKMALAAVEASEEGNYEVPYSTIVSQESKSIAVKSGKLWRQVTVKGPFTPFAAGERLPNNKDRIREITTVAARYNIEVMPMFLDASDSYGSLFLDEIKQEIPPRLHQLADLMEDVPGLLVEQIIGQLLTPDEAERHGHAFMYEQAFHECYNDSEEADIEKAA